MSTATSRRSIRRREAEAKQKIHDLELECQEKVWQIEDEVGQLEGRAETLQEELDQLKQLPNDEKTPDIFRQMNDNERELRVLQRDIRKRQDEIVKLQSRLQTAQDNINKQVEIQRELTIAEEDNDQDLSSNETMDPNEKVKRWQSDPNFEKQSSLQFSEVNSGDSSPDANFTQTKKSMSEKEGSHHSDSNYTSANQPVSAAAIGKEIATAISNALGRQGSTSSSRSKPIDKDLPEFSGKPEEWLVFRCEYDRTTAKYHYDDSENLVRLRKYLTGTAKERVTHMLSNPANCSKIMERLEKLFGRAEHVLKALIVKVTKVPSPDINHPTTVIDFGTAVDALVTSIQSYNEEEYFYDKRLLEDVISRVPPQMQLDFGTWLVNNKKKKDLRSFNEWMDACVTSVLNFSTCAINESKGRNKQSERRGGGLHSGTQEKVCVVCHKGSHPVFQCATFRQLNVTERRDVAKQNKLCFNCLGKGCIFRQCNHKGRCRVNGCGKAHNTLLHLDKQEEAQPALNPSAPPFESSGGTNSSTRQFNTLGDSDNLPVIQIMVRGPSGEMPVYALIDSAAFTMVEEDVAKKLGLDLSKKSALTFTHHGVKETVSSSTVSLEVGPRGNGNFHKIELSTIPKLRIPPRNFDARLLKQKYPYLQKMKAQSMRNARAQIIIGNDLGGLYVARQILEGRTVNDPCAVRCILGWYVAFNPDTLRKHFNSLCKTRDAETFALVRQHFELDSIGIRATTSNRSSQDKKALELLEKTTQRNGDRWETGLLWNETIQQLPESKEMATRRLYSMERKVDRNTEVADLCNERFEDYIAKGFLKKRTTEDDSDIRWYLPWFFAFHPSKKPRLVFDAAAKSHGKSFNDFMAKGPDLIHNLAAVLTRFRLHKIPLVGDIKEMFHQVQLREEDTFFEEKQSLLQGKPLPNNSRLKDMDVELNSSEIIVLRGRIGRGNVFENVKSPPVLDPHHHYTQLLIEWHHKINGHFGRELLLNQLRQEAWILNARNAVKKCFAQCLKCKERRAKPQPPLMAPLPISRVDDSKPVFHYTGVDYFGPFLTKHGRKLEKRWGVIFTCLTTRAVHLELAGSLDTDDFIQCLTRFINLREMPAQIWSDNGTNFVGAERELREAIKEWNEKEIVELLQQKRCEFFRIPAASPHMGGSWERMIRSAKKILYNLLTELHPTADTLRTLLAEVTGILNSRPLTFVSSDPDDPEPITPNHLLNIPCVIGPTFPGHFTAEDLFKKSWRYARFLASEFWKKWRKEYLPTLAKRQKWKQEVEPLKPGDIVIVLEDNAPRNQWKKGIIQDIHQAPDGQVRSAQVLIPLALPGKQKRKSPVCKYSTVTRPAVKLCRILSAVCAPEVAGRKNVAAPTAPAL